MRASDAAPARPPVAVRIRDVAPLAGLSWVRRGVRTFGRKPGGFLGLFGLAMLVMVMLVVLVPLVLIPFAFALMPLMSLGFMVATEAVHNDLPIRPGAFIEALASGSRERAALAQIGLVYVAAALAAVMLGHWIDGGELARWVTAMSTPLPDGSPPTPTPLSNRGLAGLLTLTGIIAIVSIPLWHAPALVHWGRQRAPQAMFSSVVALWHTRGAFIVYLLGWWALVMSTMLVADLVASLLGTVLRTMLVFFAQWSLTAVFYVTLWYGFEDTFEIRPLADPAPGDAQTPSV
jgi:hypothetical protein